MNVQGLPTDIHEHTPANFPADDARRPFGKIFQADRLASVDAAQLSDIQISSQPLPNPEPLRAVFGFDFWAARVAFDAFGQRAEPQTQQVLPRQTRSTFDGTQTRELFAHSKERDRSERDSPIDTEQTDATEDQRVHCRRELAATGHSRGGDRPAISGLGQRGSQCAPADRVDRPSPQLLAKRPPLVMLEPTDYPRRPELLQIAAEGLPAAGTSHHCVAQLG